MKIDIHIRNKFPLHILFASFFFIVIPCFLSACSGGNDNNTFYNTTLNISLTDPATNETGISLSSDITMVFNDTIDPNSVNQTSFILKEASSTTELSGDIFLTEQTLKFTPRDMLVDETTYFATITTGVKGITGNSLQNNFSWKFSTGQYINSNLFKPYVLIPTGSSPEAVAIGDVNNDGLNDVVMTTSFYFSPASDYKLIVFTQNSNGDLNTPVTYTTNGAFSSRPPQSVAIGDINSDGKNEVVVGNNYLNIEVFIQNGTGGLISNAIYTTDNSQRIKIADLNNDGRLDIVGVGFNTSSVDILYQNIDGSLNLPITYTVEHYGMEDLEIGDINHDNLLDIIILNSGVIPAQLAIMAQSQASFAAPVYYNLNATSPFGLAVGDITGDGKQDVVTTFSHNDGYIEVFLQNEEGTLDTPKTYNSYDIPGPVEISDVNGDGRSDVIVLHCAFDSMGVYLQNNDGTLMTEELYSLPRASFSNPHGLAMGDINNDGLVDVVMSVYDNESGLGILYHR